MNRMITAIAPYRTSPRRERGRPARSETAPAAGGGDKGTLSGAREDAPGQGDAPGPVPVEERP